MVLVGRSFFSAAGALVAGLDEEKRKEGERDAGEEKRRNITNESSLHFIQTCRIFLGCLLYLLHAVNYHRQLCIQMILQKITQRMQEKYIL